jgi:hypothetical protein
VSKLPIPRTKRTWDLPDIELQPDPKTGTFKRKKGSPWNPTEEERKIVFNMAAVGMRHSDIAIAMGITVNTLKRACKKELQEAPIKVNYKVSRKALEMALDGDPKMIMWWEMTRLGISPNKPITQEQVEGKTSDIIKLVDSDSPDKERNKL